MLYVLRMSTHTHIEEGKGKWQVKIKSQYQQNPRDIMKLVFLTFSCSFII